MAPKPFAHRAWTVTALALLAGSLVLPGATAFHNGVALDFDLCGGVQGFDSLGNLTCCRLVDFEGYCAFVLQSLAPFALDLPVCGTVVGQSLGSGKIVCCPRGVDPEGYCVDHVLEAQLAGVVRLLKSVVP